MMKGSLIRAVGGLSQSLMNGTLDTVVTDTVLKGLPNIWKFQNTVLNDDVADDKKIDKQTFSQATVTKWTDSATGEKISDDDNSKSRKFHEAVIDTTNADRLTFQTMDWGYDDFINERAIFQKSLQNPLGEQGWFYFKIFFNFDTQYGLFGGLLNDPDPMMATNSAYKYLHACESLGTYYKTNERQVALKKFAKILSYISTNAPWFFKGIKNLNQANIPQINDFTKERSIEIECSPDAIDMRLNMLMDLYKFACYDEIDQKEIIPDNLRKFDMTVVVFHSPLRYFHTSFMTSDHKKFNYKNLRVDSSTGFANTMSFKMFTFINCEIALESLGNMIPGSMSNEKPFTMGGGSIKIMYDRVYTHTMNEFMHIMFGNDGLYYDGSKSTELTYPKDDANAKLYNKQTENQLQRTESIKNIYDTEVYKEIVDASEAICVNNMQSLGFNALGNFSATNKDLQFTGKETSNGVVMTSTEYFDLKQHILKGTLSDIITPVSSTISDGVKNMISEMIETHNSMVESNRVTWPESDKMLTTDDYGFPTLSKGTNYFYRKLNAMMDGYVSPETLPTRYDGQIYDYNYSPTGTSGTTMLSDNKGHLKDSGGTDYWLNKFRELKGGTIR